ncbi:MAG: hypothetical protein WD669_11865 [Pirellulales bacterium]
MTTLFTVTVDTEEEWDWDSGWPTHDMSLSNIALLPRFQEVCDRHGVSTTYFVDQAVWDSPSACDIMMKLKQRPNVEIGMHIHPWNTRPVVGHGPVRARDTFLHNLPAGLIQEKLASVYDSFSKVGLRPTSFRGGRYSSGGAIHDFLYEHHFLADASVCPFSTWQDEGAPDYRHRGLDPVRLPPRQNGELPLWEIPLTLAFTRSPFSIWRDWYDLVERTWLSKLRLIGIGERLGIVRKVWLNFESPLGLHMRSFLDRLQKLAVQTICFTLHSSSLLPGGNSFTRTEEDAARLFARLEAVFQFLSTRAAFQPATVTEVAQQLEARYDASLGT